MPDTTEGTGCRVLVWQGRPWWDLARAALGGFPFPAERPCRGRAYGGRDEFGPGHLQRVAPVPGLPGEPAGSALDSWVWSEEETQAGEGQSGLVRMKGRKATGLGDAVQREMVRTLGSLEEPQRLSTGERDPDKETENWGIWDHGAADVEEEVSRRKERFTGPSAVARCNRCGLDGAHLVPVDCRGRRRWGGMGEGRPLGH